MKNVNFAVIGCGLMGREFASVSMRWLHLLGNIPRPVILAACDLNDDNLNWFKQVPDCKYFYHNYQEMLENPEIEAVYCAVPHHLHAKVYGDVIRAGKHLIGEKPFGVDLEAMKEIKAAMEGFTQKVYAIFGKLYQQQAPEGAAPDMGAQGYQQNADGTYEADGDIH